MKISKDKVVYIYFTLRDEAGAVLDSNVGGDPLAYLHGHGNLIPGLERALEGRTSGERFEVTVPPTEAYGEHDPGGMIEVPRSTLSPEVVVEIGNHVQTMGPEGRIEFTIVGFDDERVMLDGNHPLAGRTLHFEVEVGAIRDAHPDEVKHHRVHPAGHHLMVMDSSFDESLLKQAD
ncbi:MAG: peptidylprolyl isomerase [Gammaproteobacteria bacterium]|nr:peptidylprolyl isomerase [Gammaproteobacteria bacterium]